MAEPLDDTDDRRPADRPPDDRPPDDRPEDWLERRHPELEAAEFEAEQPARDLTGLPKLIISVAAVAVSLYALLWVVRPQPAQPYRTSFLAVTLAMTLLAYRPLTRGRASGAGSEAGGDNPGPLDWALAALALVSLVYPLLVFDDFARRVVRPTGLDVVLGVVAVLLVLEATRRTVGWVLPASASSWGWARACRRSRTAPSTPSSGRAACPPAPSPTWRPAASCYCCPPTSTWASSRSATATSTPPPRSSRARYQGVEAPVKVVAVPNYLVAHRSMDPELAYQLTRLLFDRKEALAEVHPSASRLELETAPDVAPLELHPGARRYYDEQART
jgi:hypothetical protein